MNEKFDENLLKNVEELINCSDRELLTLSLSKNPQWADNYQMAITIKLKKTLLNLNKDIRKLKKSMNISSWVMGIMTFFILVLTGTLVWKGF